MAIASRLSTLILLLVTMMSALSLANQATAQDRRVRIINASNAIVNNFYASNAQRRSWEEDILGRSVLAPGQSVVINIDDGSGAYTFDFKSVLASGRAIESYGLWTIR